jgi:hypothetical protein
MPRSRVAALAAVGAAALAAAGVAVADHSTQTTQKAAAQFSATTVSHSRATSCVASDGPYEDTTATYTGAAVSSDPRLNGGLEIRAHSVVNTSSGLGWLDGSFRIRGGNAGDARGTIHAAIAGASAIGTFVGTVNRPSGKLVASFVSPFAPATGFGSGATLGEGQATSGAGTIFSRGACTKAKNFPKTAVFALRLTPNEVVSATKASKAGASGSMKLSLTRDSTGAITGAQITFRVTYRFASPVAIGKLALYKGARGSAGQLTADTGTNATNASRGTISTSATGVSPADAQALLTSPQDYYVQLDTSGGSLRDQLGRYRRR